jgi:hypothetical protein
MGVIDWVVVQGVVGIRTEDQDFYILAFLLVLTIEMSLGSSGSQVRRGPSR